MQYKHDLQKVVFSGVLGVSEGGKGGGGERGVGVTYMSGGCCKMGRANRSAALACRCHWGITGCVTCIVYRSCCMFAACFDSWHIWGLLPQMPAVGPTLPLLYLDASVKAGAQPLQYGRNTLSSFAERIQHHIQMQAGRGTSIRASPRMP